MHPSLFSLSRSSLKLRLSPFMSVSSAPSKAGHRVDGDKTMGSFMNPVLEPMLGSVRVVSQRGILFCIHTRAVLPDQRFFYDLSLTLNFLLNVLLSLSSQKEVCASSELTCPCESGLQSPTCLTRSPTSLPPTAKTPRFAALLFDDRPHVSKTRRGHKINCPQPLGPGMVNAKTGLQIDS